jgi:DNA polymerase I-like protein with 3'-5' exonuclease and polymerase domains
MSSLALTSLDIETCCAVDGCPGFGLAGTKCDHALSPWHGRITKIGVVSGANQEVAGRSGFNHVYNSVESYLGDRSSHLGSATQTFVGHNFKFDLLWLQVHGVDISKVDWHCTQLMAYVLTDKIPDGWLASYEGARGALGAAGETWHRKAGKHSLKTLAPYFLGVEMFWETENKEDDEYVLKDATYTLQLASVLEAKLKERGEWDFYLRLLGWTKMLLAAELRGIQIDLDALTQKEYELTQKREELRSKLDEQWAEGHQSYFAELRIGQIEKYQAMAKKFGKDLVDSPKHVKLLEASYTKLSNMVDYDSPKQMAWLLRDYYGYNITSLEGDETTGREVLERLASEGKQDVATFLEWRQTNKLLTSFIPTYKELQVNGRLHPIYNSSTTVTGRLSSQRPNGQQAPTEMKVLIKPTTGNKFVGYDLKQIEALLIALYTGDEALTKLVMEDISIHSFSAKEFLDLPCAVSEVKEKFENERDATKNCIYALFFNAGKNRIRATFAQKGIHLTEQQCRSIHERFKRTYPDAYSYGQDLVKFFEQGNIVTNLPGRPLRIENPEDCFMKSLNLLVQSSASDLLLEWAYRSRNRLTELGIEINSFLFVHDFFQFEVAEEKAVQVSQVIMEELQGFVLENKFGRLTLRAEGGISDQWL